MNHGADFGVQVLGARVQVIGADADDAAIDHDRLGMKRKDWLRLARCDHALLHHAPLYLRIGAVLEDLQAHREQLAPLLPVAAECRQVIGGG